jgi:hypothetical protein
MTPEQKIVNLLKEPTIGIDDTARLLIAAGESLKLARNAWANISADAKADADDMLNQAKKTHAEFARLTADLAKQADAYNVAAEATYRRLTAAAERVRSARQDLSAEMGAVPQVGDLERLLSLVERLQYLSPEVRALFAATARTATGGGP